MRTLTVPVRGPGAWPARLERPTPKRDQLVRRRMERSALTMSHGGFMLMRSKLRCMTNCKAVVRTTRIAVNHTPDLRWRWMRCPLKQYANPVTTTIDGNPIAPMKAGDGDGVVMTSFSQELAGSRTRAACTCTSAASRNQAATNSPRPRSRPLASSGPPPREQSGHPFCARSVLNHIGGRSRQSSKCLARRRTRSTRGARALPIQEPGRLTKAHVPAY